MACMLSRPEHTSKVWARNRNSQACLSIEQIHFLLFAKVLRLHVFSDHFEKMKPDIIKCDGDNNVRESVGQKIRPMLSSNRVIASCSERCPRGYGHFKVSRPTASSSVHTHNKVLINSESITKPSASPNTSVCTRQGNIPHLRRPTLS